MNQFIDGSPELIAMLDQLALFACSKETEGTVCGLPVKKEVDGSVCMPIAMTARVWPVKPNRDGKLKHRIVINLQFASQELPWIGKISGSRGPTTTSGQDRVSLWVNTEQATEEMMAEEGANDQGTQEDNW